MFILQLAKQSEDQCRIPLIFWQDFSSYCMTVTLPLHMQTYLQLQTQNFSNLLYYQSLCKETFVQQVHTMFVALKMSLMFDIITPLPTTKNHNQMSTYTMHSGLSKIFYYLMFVQQHHYAYCSQNFSRIQLHHECLHQQLSNHYTTSQWHKLIAFVHLQEYLAFSANSFIPILPCAKFRGSTNCFRATN